MKVFWSWQSDTLEKNNRYFVRDALERAVQIVANDLDLDEADRPEVDHDTAGEPGLVAIVDTIFDKISKAAVFVGDLTYVGKSDQGKLLPNPNVMIELGHAITSLGPKRIILVTNQSYGGRPEDLPFDLRHRRAPIAYNLPASATTGERNKARDALAKSLADALAGSLGIAMDATAKEIQFPEAPARDGDRSTWLQEGEKIDHHDFFHGTAVREWTVLEEPRFYLRVVPASHNGSITPRAVQDLRQDNAGLSAMGPWRNGDGGVNVLGVVAVGLMDEQTVCAASQWFKETSEIWTFNCLASFKRSADAPRLLSWGVFPNGWHRCLDKSLAMLKHLGVKGPFLVEAGVTGLHNVKWGDDFGRQYSPLADEAFVRKVDLKWAEETRLSFLTSAFNRLCDVYNRPHVDEAQFLRIR